MCPPVCDHHHPEDLPRPVNLPHPADPPIRPISPSKPTPPTVPTVPAGPVMPAQQTDVNVQPTTRRPKRKQAQEPVIHELYVNVNRNTADLAAVRTDILALRLQMDRMERLLVRFVTGLESDDSLMEE